MKTRKMSIAMQLFLSFFGMGVVAAGVTGGVCYYSVSKIPAVEEFLFSMQGSMDGLFEYFHCVSNGNFYCVYCSLCGGGQGTAEVYKSK